MTVYSSNASSPLLQSKGWEACVDARLIRSSDQWHDVSEFRAHGHALRRFFADVKMDAVLSVEGRPSVCIKDTRQISPTGVEDLRRQLWNLGATTLFVAESQHDIKVFSTLVRPVKDDAVGNSALLANETIQQLQAVELALRLTDFVYRVETGAIYRQYTSQFDSRSAVDRHLLENLREARNIICPEKTQKGYRRAHSLIGRFLFSCYLLDRHIIGPAYLKKSSLPEAEDMLELLKKAGSGSPTILVRLFKVLQRDFNGSLFGDILDDDVGIKSVTCLQRFLSGENLRTGQLSLFKLYDFGFIPVELISAIYEEFLGAEAQLETKQGQRGGNHSQRTQGAYYTPPRLAELAVDIATEGWDTLLDKRCLDPACGSGIFLVILFIRMAEEWRKRNPGATTRKRYDELLRLLSENLRGGDIHLTACLVTCFSLYLAFLDQMEPKEVIELQEALERDAKEKILPRILWESGKPRPKTPHFVTVKESDFFLLPIEKEFHLVIGNPPWVSRKAAPTAEKWLFSKKDNPYHARLNGREENQTLFPARELACAFMWKAGLHLLPMGRVCQILPSRVFLSNNTDRFQEFWLDNHRLETLWLLADWSFILFPTADCPCFVSRYHLREEGEAFGRFEFITPKVELLDPRAASALIPVLPEDQKTLSESDIVSATRNREAASEWKEHHWGTPRDERLLQRLLSMPRLSRLAKRPGRSGASTGDKRHRWHKGQGFRGATESTEKPYPVFWKTTDLFLSAQSPVWDLILLPANCEPIGNRFKTEGLDRKRNPLIYKAPLLLINKACTKFLFSDFDVLFQDDFQSISAPKDEEEELLFLTAVLSSPLAQYLLFHTTANIGIERDIARLEEILDLPFPLPEDMRNPRHSRSVLHGCAQRLRKLRGDLQKPDNLLRQAEVVEEAKRELYGLICQYFEISDWESHLIDDTVAIFRPSSTPGSLDSSRLITAKNSTHANRKEYAETLVKTFQNWSRTKRHLWSQTSVASRIGLALLTFGIADKPIPYAEHTLEEAVVKALETIRKTTSRNGTLFSRLRGFALYEPDRVHILKPLNRRHWTRTAALNDADDILTRMMEENGWRN